MVRKFVNYLLTFVLALVPTVWLIVQIQAHTVQWWLVVLWAMAVVFAIAITYDGKESR